MMSLQSFCQTATSTKDPNDLVCFPRYILGAIIKDLKDGDYAKEEVFLLNNQISLHTEYIIQQDSSNKLLRQHNIYLSGLVDDKDTQINNLTSQLNQTNRDYDKRGYWIKGLAIGLGASIITAFAIK
jgi:hypothetical protein